MCRQRSPHGRLGDALMGVVHEPRDVSVLVDEGEKQTYQAATYTTKRREADGLTLRVRLTPQELADLTRRADANHRLDVQAATFPRRHELSVAARCGVHVDATPRETRRFPKPTVTVL